VKLTFVEEDVVFVSPVDDGYTTKYYIERKTRKYWGKKKESENKKS